MVIVHVLDFIGLGGILASLYALVAGGLGSIAAPICLLLSFGLFGLGSLIRIARSIEAALRARSTDQP